VAAGLPAGTHGFYCEEFSLNQQDGSSPRELHPDQRAVLFDIDGTLLRGTRGREYREEICRMLVELFGTEGRLRDVDFAGRTDLSIYREALEPAGIDPSVIRDRLPELQEGSVEVVRRMSRTGQVFYLCAGVRELLDELSNNGHFALSLLTGNLEKLARTKLHDAGIGGYFRLRGAFGSDAEDRNQLPAIAASRLAEQLGRPVPPQRMIIIGDTPRDIACARHYGARAVAVASGRHTMDQLRQLQPDGLLPDLSNTEEVLRLLTI